MSANAASIEALRHANYARAAEPNCRRCGAPLRRIGLQRRCTKCRNRYIQAWKNGQSAWLKLERAEQSRAEALAELARLGLRP